MKPLTISTNARPSDLRPKIMRELYGGNVVSLLCKGGRPALTGLRNPATKPVLHLIAGSNIDWAEMEWRFGETVAEFNPARNCWVEPLRFHQDERMSVKELLVLIGDGEVCMGGKDCPKHK